MALKFVDIYNRRVEAKKNGNKKVEAPLKLVLNTTYGAMKSEYNELYDPHMANQVCITGQLLLLDLIEKLEPYIKLIQSSWLYKNLSNLIKGVIYKKMANGEPL